MEKTKYIKPEIDVVAHLAQPFLAGISGNVVNSEEDKPTPPINDGGGTSNPDEFSRQHNNWMWDTMEDEY